MLPEQILIKINAYQKTLRTDAPAIEHQFTKNEVLRHLQMLSRKNVKPEAFKLVHLWVDLRSLAVPAINH
jgi:hypothetical protein